MYFKDKLVKKLYLGDRLISKLIQNTTVLFQKLAYAYNIIYGSKLGYVKDYELSESYPSFVIYSGDTAYVGTFKRLLRDTAGTYYIPASDIGRISLTSSNSGEWSTAPWKLYSPRNIGTAVTYFNVPVYSYEDDSVLLEDENYSAFVDTLK